MEETCLKCEGSGFVVVERPDKTRAARECDCRTVRRAARTASRARIPNRYEHCTLESFDTEFHACTQSIKKGLKAVAKFVESYPLENRGVGLLITGSIGVGKTHLAVAAIQALGAKGAQCLFCDYRELLKSIQNTYNQSVRATEREVLEPVFQAEVLVLDELGAAKLTDWVWDTVAHILNTRYNDRKITIITANYLNKPAILGPGEGDSALAEVRAALREETLGDRIGERMRSRLQEMCFAIEMRGADFRELIKKAQLT